MPSQPSARIVERGGDSDLGCRRQINQDRMLAIPPLFAVADGMGGQAGGEVASSLTIETLAAHAGAWTADVPETLQTLVGAANDCIRGYAEREPAYSGMGTTLVAAVVHDADVTVAHVGDSRAYRLRDRKLERLTEDHTVVAELVRLGALSPEEAEAHPQRDRLARALGPQPAVEAEIHTRPARDCDIYLLCSDGLTKMVGETRIEEILAAGGTLDQAGDQLVEAANASGGRDNVTVCLFRVEVSEDAKRPVTSIIDQSVISQLPTVMRETRR